MRATGNNQRLNGAESTGHPYAPFVDCWRRTLGDPPAVLFRVLADLRKRVPDAFASGLVLQSFANFIEETPPQYINERTPLSWGPKWKAYVNDGEHYRRQVDGSDLMQGL